MQCVLYILSRTVFKKYIVLFEKPPGTLSFNVPVKSHYEKHRRISVRLKKKIGFPQRLVLFFPDFKDFFFFFPLLLGALVPDFDTPNS